MKRAILSTAIFLSGSLLPNALGQTKLPDGPPLSGTKPLELQGDIASLLVDGADRFLLRELERSIDRRGKYWKRDFSSVQNYENSILTNRQRLAAILGVRDERISFPDVELKASTGQPALVGRGAGFEVFAARWPAFGDVHGEGLLLMPTGRPPLAHVIVLPDADQHPEQLVGLMPGIPESAQIARRLAESGIRVLVPTLINRRMDQAKNSRDNRGAGLSNREYLYRSAFELGRHLIGYELQKVFAGLDWFERTRSPGSRIGVAGWGEGGLLALYATALDSRIDSTLVSGYFDSRQNLWQEPLDRNVFGLLEQFGDAELAAMVAPRRLTIEAARGPEVTLPGKGGGGPARLITPDLPVVEKEISRARSLLDGFGKGTNIVLSASGAGRGEPYTSEALQPFLEGLSSEARLKATPSVVENLREAFDPAPRHRAQMHELDRHSQALLIESPYVREKFFSGLDTKSLTNFSRTVESYRKFFYDEVVGRYDEVRLPPSPRSRVRYEKPTWTGYEVVLDVFPDVMAYGVLLLPKGMKPDERRPVVVCQHGLEGRPQHVIEGDEGAYHDYAAKLAERGFITFAPQNLYIFNDRFRSLQRKSYPLKKTLFSIIVPQHQQIVDWLSTLPNVDPQRIAFYGLSYGGKTAMRVPPLVTNYCLSICSADFNEWVWKNASTRSPYSYVWTGEYEIFEFDLGSTFNYAEMAALIAPRPFMVERGHFDGVAPDEAVGYEFAKVLRLYGGKLGLADRCEIEWFAGPHTIHGVGTFNFLERHLKWP